MRFFSCANNDDGWSSFRNYIMIMKNSCTRLLQFHELVRGHMQFLIGNKGLSAIASARDPSSRSMCCFLFALFASLKNAIRRCDCNASVVYTAANVQGYTSARKDDRQLLKYGRQGPRESSLWKPGRPGESFHISIIHYDDESFVVQYILISYRVSSGSIRNSNTQDRYT